MNTTTILHNIQVTADVVHDTGDERHTRHLPIFTVKDNVADSAFGDAFEIATAAVWWPGPPLEVYITIYTPETSIQSRAWRVVNGIARVIA